MRHGQARYLIGDYALGILEAGEVRDLERHIYNCQACTLESEAFTYAAGALAAVGAIDPGLLHIAMPVPAMPPGTLARIGDLVAVSLELGPEAIEPDLLEQVHGNGWPTGAAGTIAATHVDRWGPSADDDTEAGYLRRMAGGDADPFDEVGPESPVRVAGMFTQPAAPVGNGTAWPWNGATNGVTTPAPAPAWDEEEADDAWAELARGAPAGDRGWQNRPQPAEALQESFAGDWRGDADSSALQAAEFASPGDEDPVRDLAIPQDGLETPSAAEFEATALPVDDEAQHVDAWAALTPLATAAEEPVQEFALAEAPIPADFASGPAVVDIPASASETLTVADTVFVPEAPATFDEFEPEDEWSLLAGAPMPRAETPFAAEAAAPLEPLPIPVAEPVLELATEVQEPAASAEEHVLASTTLEFDVPEVLPAEAAVEIPLEAPAAEAFAPELPPPPMPIAIPQPARRGLFGRFRRPATPELAPQPPLEQPAAATTETTDPWAALAPADVPVLEEQPAALETVAEADDALAAPAALDDPWAAITPDVAESLAPADGDAVQDAAVASGPAAELDELAVESPIARRLREARELAAAASVEPVDALVVPEEPVSLAAEPEPSPVAAAPWAAPAVEVHEESVPTAEPPETAAADPWAALALPSEEPGEESPADVLMPLPDALDVEEQPLPGDGLAAAQLAPPDAAPTVPAPAEIPRPGFIGRLFGRSRRPAPQDEHGTDDWAALLSPEPEEAALEPEAPEMPGLEAVVVAAEDLAVVDEEPLAEAAFAATEAVMDEPEAPAAHADASQTLGLPSAEFTGIEAPVSRADGEAAAAQEAAAVVEDLAEAPETDGLAPRLDAATEAEAAEVETAALADDPWASLEAPADDALDVEFSEPATDIDTSAEALEQRPMVATEGMAAAALSPAPEARKPGFFGRLFGRGAKVEPTEEHPADDWAALATAEKSPVAEDTLPEALAAELSESGMPRESVEAPMLPEAAFEEAPAPSVADAAAGFEEAHPELAEPVEVAPPDILDLQEAASPLPEEPQDFDKETERPGEDAAATVPTPLQPSSSVEDVAVRPPPVTEVIEPPSRRRFGWLRRGAEPEPAVEQRDDWSDLVSAEAPAPAEVPAASVGLPAEPAESEPYPQEAAAELPEAPAAVDLPVEVALPAVAETPEAPVAAQAEAEATPLEEESPQAAEVELEAGIAAEEPEAVVVQPEEPTILDDVAAAALLPSLEDDDEDETPARPAHPGRRRFGVFGRRRTRHEERAEEAALDDWSDLATAPTAPEPRVTGVAPVEEERPAAAVAPVEAEPVAPVRPRREPVTPPEPPGEFDQELRELTGEDEPRRPGPPRHREPQRRRGPLARMLSGGEPDDDPYDEDPRALASFDEEMRRVSRPVTSVAGRPGFSPAYIPGPVEWGLESYDDEEDEEEAAERVSSTWRYWAIMFGAVAVLLFGIMVTGYFVLRDRATESSQLGTISDGGTQGGGLAASVRFTAPNAGPDDNIRGDGFVQPGGDALLELSGLPNLVSGQRYVIWAESDAGVVTKLADRLPNPGSSTQYFSVQRVPADIERLFITVETRVDGEVPPQPVGEVVLETTIQ